jgi:hypothetical protein
MFIYIVINETNYPVGTFVDINDARNYKNSSENYKIIKSTLVGELPSLGSKLKDKMGLGDMKKAQADLPDDLKKIFNMK